MFIDTHCHLDATAFDADRAEVVATARAAGVGQIVVPAVQQANFAAVLHMRADYGCPVALGLHPLFVRQHQDTHLQDLHDAIATHRPVAVGEIGLDYFVPGLDVARQEWLLVEQLRLARAWDLPVLLHVRKSQDRVLKYLRQEGIRRGIAHAFNGSQAQAEAYIAQGFKLGFGGMLTFTRARQIRRLAATLPLQALVLETDAPDMPPSWAYRQRNSPAYLPAIAAELARLRGLQVEEVAAATSANARAVLGPLA